MIMFKSNHMKNCIALLLLASLAISCGTVAKIEKSWRDPDTQVNMEQLNKILVVAHLRNEADRRATEDKMAAYLNGKGVVSYTFLTKEVKEEEKEKVRAKLKAEGYDGVVVMRLLDVDKDVQYVPGTISTYPTYYRGFYGYYYNSFNRFYDPGYYQTTKTYLVEMNIYSLKQDKLIYSAVTSTANPENVDKLTNAVTKSVYNKIKSEGFITGLK